MATTLLGHLEPFDPDTDEWTQYVERMEEMLQANDLIGEAAKNKRRSIFLSVVGKRTYNILRSLLAPTKPSEKTFEQLTAILTTHFSPPPSEVIQRFRFHSRTRQAGESVSSFVAELRRLTEHCNFGDELKKALRDRIVAGINDKAMQRKLLSEDRLTYERAIEVAQGVETAGAHLKELNPHSKPIKQEPVHKVSKTPGFKGSGKKKGETQNTQTPCYRCGTEGHPPRDCRFKHTVCNYCKKEGHIARACCKKSTRESTYLHTATPRRKVHYLEEEMSVSSEEDTDPIHTIISNVKDQKDKSPPIHVEVGVNGRLLDMEVDTGASLTLISEDKYTQLYSEHALKPTSIRLQTYLGKTIPVVGSIVVAVEYQDQKCDLPMVVVKGNGPTLLGRNWLTKIRLDWHNIYYHQQPHINQLEEKYSDVFVDELGTFKNYEAHLEIDPTAPARFSKARPVPYAMRQGVEEELDRLLKEGTLEPVEYSDWAAPIVAVLKPDKTVRICGDFRSTVNAVSKLHRYPIPRVDDLFASLVRGKLFTTIDLKQAYQQIKLDASSKKYLVINTDRGLFRYSRLPYGVSSAPGLFQKAMEQLFRGIPGVAVYIDDILITGPTEADHLKSLEEVLKRLSNAGLRAKKHKCHFLQPRVTFLGHVIDQDGLHPIPAKVQAIQDAPTPQNVSQLKSYLGLLTYYGKFLPNLSTVLAPLYHLLKKSSSWTWSKAQEQAFLNSKGLLLSSQLLVHFDPSLPLLLACDASQYGIGAVLAHKMPDGSERPIGYVSRTLNSAEKNYAQLEKEGLSLIFGIKRFYSYLIGHSFTLITDHKPLLGLLSEHKSTSIQASARIKRWSLYLSMFDYTLTFRRTTEHANADALSRLPLSHTTKPVQPTELVLLATHLGNSPVSAGQIAEATSKDPTLSLVSQYVNQGWPRVIPGQPQVSPYFNKQNELSTFEGCLLWGSRVIIPKQYQEAVLTQLHEGHQGIVRTKTLARMYVWWPGLTNDIDRLIRQCPSCQETRADPVKAPLHSWSWPSRPWARLHLDYAGPVEGKMVLVMIDSHSKWIEATPTPNATSTTVIETCRERFAQFGLPETIVTDNGTCFTSLEFKSFLQQNGIRHITTAPYHPASNGLAERVVQIVKAGLKKNATGTFRSRLSVALASYRLTPHATTGKSPCELLIGRRYRSRLDFLRPNTAEKVEEKLNKQKQNYDVKSKPRIFELGTPVFVRNVLSGNKWVPGVIISSHGNVSYSVQLNGGRVRKCHINQLRERHVQIELTSTAPPVLDIPSTPNPTVKDSEIPNRPNPELETPQPVTETNPKPAKKQYPTRNRQIVDRYDPSFT